MPLFQPSNITPSSFAGVGGGTVAVSDNVKITWQVNGNTPMTAYKIDIFDMNNKIIYAGNVKNTMPFYPTDRHGNPQYFLYEPNVSWADYGLTDGNEYTLQITQYWGNSTDSDHSVTQFSQSSFITRTNPTLKITTAGGEENFSTIFNISQDFRAVYYQEQNDVIDTVRWQIYQDGNLIDDTGIVNTQRLNYNADALQSGKNYKIVCTIQTENGVQISAENTFIVSYELASKGTRFNFNCVDKASTLLSWSEIQENIEDDIQGISNDNRFNFEKGSLLLQDDSTITWNTKNGEDLSIPAEWSMAWNGSVCISPMLVNNPIRSGYCMATYGKCFIIGTGNGIACYTFQNDELKFKQTFGSGRVSLLEFSPDGSLLIARTTSQLRTIIAWDVSYDENGTPTFTANTTLFFNTNISTAIRTFAFKSDSQLIVGLDSSDGTNYGYGQIWHISNGAVSKIESITAYMETEILDMYLSHNKKYLFIKTYEKLSLFQVVIGGITDTNVSLKDNEGNILTGLSVIDFSNDGLTLAVADKGGVSLYSCNDFTKNEEYISPKLFFSTKNNNISALTFDKEKLSIIVSGTYNETSGTQNDVIKTKSFMEIYKLIGEDVNFYKEIIIEEKKSIDYGTPVSPISVNATKYINEEKFFLFIADSSSSSYSFQSFYETRSIFNTNNFNLSFNNGIKAKYENNVLYEQPFELAVNYNFLDMIDYNVSFFTINKNNFNIIVNGELNEIKIEDEIVQTNITEIILHGEQICNYVYISNETVSMPYDFTPVWINNTSFMTRFNLATLQSGQYQVAKQSMDIYRENVSTGALEKLYSCNGNTTQIRDFSWITNNNYHYYGYARLDNRYTSVNSFIELPICRKQPYYLLLATKQDEEQQNTYHVVHYWRFGNNVEASSISNNNTPSFLNNFTGYRLKQPTTRKGKSGTLQALLSNVVNGQYKDTTLEMENLYALSKCNNPLFLKDMKGNLYMVTVSGPITQTIHTKSKYQEVKVSIPWEEIGPADGVSIIQLPTDEGWIDDNAQLAEVRLEVNEETGMLKVVYPDDYNFATTFSLVRPNIYATTANGVEQADLELTDGAMILNKED